MAGPCTTWVPGTPAERWILLGLLLLATVLRMWDLPHIPFMHDEISALTRLYPTLGETLLRGVIELDTHPPGVQIFEWLWTRAFGSSEAVVKLPFMVMSIAALFFLYRFACAWTNAAVALIAISLMATLQYFVLYGQIARPYAFGLFTTALMADQLTRFLARSRTGNLVWFLVAAVLSSYAHHFGLLQAALIGATGLALVTREHRKSYLIACGAIVLAYLPNIPIFLHQFSQGGLGGWLQAPDRHWLGDYAWWIVHCSLPMALAGGALVLFSLVGRSRTSGRGGPFWWIALTWGLVPLAVGFGYSIWRAPVLQYSVLIFSVPYLLLLLLSGIQHLSWKSTALISACVAATSVFTLVTVRSHYDLFYRSKYEAMIRDGMKAQARTHGDCLVLLDAPEHVIRFYMERWGISDADFPYVQLRDRDARPILRALADDTLHQHLFIGVSTGAQPEDIPRAELAYPTLIERHDYFEGQTVLLTRTPGERSDLQLFSTLEPGKGGEAWVVSADLPVVKDSAGIASGWSYTGREFGIEFVQTTHFIVQDPSDQIIVLADGGASGGTKAHLIAELQLGDSTVFYRGDDALATPSSVQQMVVAVSPSDARLRGRSLRLKSYIWNEGRGPLLVGGLSVLTRAQNPVQHALYGPITGPWTYH